MRLEALALIWFALSAPGCQWLRGGASARADDLVAHVDGKGGRPISPYIFGFGSGMEKDRAEAFAQKPTFYRFGGNASERFNWKANAYNASSDWNFTNLTLAFPDAVDRFLADNQKQGVASAVTLPLLGWVAKDGSSASFPKATANGLDAAGKRLKAEPAATSLKIDAAFVAEWVVHLKTRFGTFPHFYILGNEPMLWGDTHRDVHPEPTTYDEYLQKYLATAVQVRQADPAAVLVGPAEWGWLSIHQSQAGDADRKRHGDVPFLEWFLTEVTKKEKELGVSLLDVLDYHYYPIDLTLYDESKVDAATRKLRLASTRSLWDKQYKEGGWINAVIEFLPSLKRIIAKTKPELKLAVGEYNFHGERDVSGAIALAEVLRVFIEQDVYVAAYWIDPPKDSPAAAAFRLYRNYDGAGAAFGDRFLESRFGPHDDVTLVAAKSEQEKKVTVIVLNKSVDQARTMTLTVDGLPSMKSTKSFELTAKSPATLATRALPTSKEARLALPPLSASLVEFRY